MVEFVGLPGCGKTTYVERCISKNDVIAPLEEWLYDVSRIKQNINKIYFCAYIIIFDYWNYKQVNCIFNTIHFENIKVKIKMWLYLFSTMGVINKAKKLNQNKELAFDEGILQVIWGILYNNVDSQEQVWRLYESVNTYLADEIVVFQIDKDCILERLLKRNKKGGSELEHEVKEDPSKIYKAIECLESIISKLEIQGKQIQFYSGEKNENYLFDK